MIKPLPYYLIPRLFQQNIKNDEPWNNMDVENILEDFYILIKKLGIDEEIYLDGSSDWQDDSELLDLQLNIEEQYKDSWGSFYVTWYKDDWKCKHIWYSGNTDDDEQVFLDWENK